MQVISKRIYKTRRRTVIPGEDRQPKEIAMHGFLRKPFGESGGDLLHKVQENLINQYIIMRGIIIR